MEGSIQSALVWAARGLRVFPILPGTKKPRDKQFYDTATSDPAKIVELFAGATDYNVGVSTDDLLVVDVDRKNGIDGMPAFLELDFSLNTLVVRTPSGGFHFYYAARSTRNTAGKLAPGIDTRSHHGYVLAPGSVTPEGAYSLDSDAPMAEAPESILQRLEAPPASADRSSDRFYDDETAFALGKQLIENDKGAVQGAGGDTHTVGVAFQLRDCGLGPGAALDLMWREWNDKCAPPWDFNDLQRKVDSAYRSASGVAGARHPRSAFGGMKPAAAMLPTHGEGATMVRATPYVWRDPATIPPRPWVYGRYLLRGTVTAFVAPGGIGKSTFVASTALSLVTDRPLMGKTVWGGSKRVWIWNLEDDLDELSRAIQAAAKHFAIPQDDLNSNLFVDSTMDGSPLCTAVEVNGQLKLLQPVYDAIVAELLARRIDVLIIDPFVSSHEVEENANSKVDKIAKAWGRVAKGANCAIVLVHHTSKAGAAEVTVNSARGASALMNACRSALVFNRLDPEEAKKFGIDGDDERRRYFRVQDDKHNRAPPEKADWYRLIPVDLGNGPGGRGDSVGVAEPWSPPEATDGLGPDDLRRVQDAIAAGSWRQSP